MRLLPLSNLTLTHNEVQIIKLSTHSVLKLGTWVLVLMPHSPSPALWPGANQAQFSTAS